MYLHKENRELFHDAILLASQKQEVSESLKVNFQTFTQIIVLCVSNLNPWKFQLISAKN